MSKRSCKPEEIIAKLRQVDVLHSQGSTIADAIRQIGVSEVTFYRWRKEYGGMKTDQLKRLWDQNRDLPRSIAWQGLADWCYGPCLSTENIPRCLDALTTVLQRNDFTTPSNAGVYAAGNCFGA